MNQKVNQNWYKTRSPLRSLLLTGLSFLMAVFSATCVPSATSNLIAQTHQSNGLHYTTSWLGNSFGGADRKHVQSNIAAISVADDGTVYCNTIWDEGGREGGIYKDGDVMGQLQGTHTAGRVGGWAVTSNGQYVFASLVQLSLDGAFQGTAFPPVQTNWYGVSRFDLEGNPVPFADGMSEDANFLKVNQETAAGYTDFSDANIAGLAADRTHLYLSNPMTNEIWVYEPEQMRQMARWSVDRPGKLRLDLEGNLWVIQTADSQYSSQIIKLRSDGTLLPQVIDDVDDPVGIAVDPQNRLLVADNGINQQIRIYDHLDSTPRLVETFGETGGVFAGNRPGRVAPLRFHNLSDVDVDGNGNIYVSQSNVGLESYQPNGDRNWVLYGLHFQDIADVDPLSDGREVYTKEERFAMDYNQSTGQEWEYVAHTVNPFQYPQDTRLHLDAHETFVRRIQGRKYLYLSNSAANYLQAFRFDEASDGDIAIPSTMLTKRSDRDTNQAIEGNWITHQPQINRSWIWIDANGNGAFDAGEFEVAPMDDNPYVWAWWVDSEGGVWKGTREEGIQYFPLQGLDQYGNPIYSYDTMELIENPVPFMREEYPGDVNRIEYYPETDTMYLSGFNSTVYRNPGTVGLIGRVVARYDHWSQGNRTPSWEIAVPFDTESDPPIHPKSMSVSGDYLFIVESYSQDVYVFDINSGRRIGTLQPDPAIVGEELGLIDILQGIRAYQRSNGEYLIFVEEDRDGKVILYRMTDDRSDDVTDG
ncbi:hypothetical protein [Egbenema bharatensis]|uniref:hypothetical protein n=1 Tax=Egbenema bharatensis TaxID=3463334 RepID=UPI003A8A08AD